MVEAQVKLTDFHDGGLYLLIELMAEGVRQFITFEERLRVDPSLKDQAQFSDFYRPRDIQREYFEVLEQLRFHMHSCLTQVATIADMETPKIDSYLKANEEWLLSLYHKPPQLIGKQGVTSGLQDAPDVAPVTQALTVRSLSKADCLGCANQLPQIAFFEPLD